MPRAGDQLPEFNKGDKAKASDMQALVRQIRSLSVQGDGTNGMSLGGAKVTGKQRPTVAKDQDVCMIRNDSGADVTVQFSVLQIGSLVTDPNAVDVEALSIPYVSGVEVDTDDTPKIAVLQQLADEDQWSLAVSSGCTFVRLVGPSGKEFATPKQDESTLEAGDSGPCVILADPGPADEERIAWVRIGGGGGSSCTLKIKLLIMGFPDSGDLTLPLTVNSVQEDVVITMPASPADVIAAFETHSEIVAGTVYCDIHGADLPYAEATIWLDGLEPGDYSIENWSSTMTGGPHTAYAVLSYCC